MTPGKEEGKKKRLNKRICSLIKKLYF